MNSKGPGHRVSASPGSPRPGSGSNAAADVVKVVPPHIGLSSELTHAGRPYELTLLVSTVLVVTENVRDTSSACLCYCTLLKIVNTRYTSVSQSGNVDLLQGTGENSTGE